MNEGEDRGIFWIASYPKSGNTWIRVFLENLISESENPADINNLNGGRIASSREWVQQAIGYDISELSHEEVDELRPHAYRWLAAQKGMGYHKIHDAYTYLADGKPLIPGEATSGAVYIVRNPLDIVPSYASYFALEIPDAVENICNSNLALSASECRQSTQLRQRLGTWSEHVNSWLDADIRKLVIKYEDLISEPIQGFISITNFLNLDKDADQVAEAVERSSFDSLRKQEDDLGFRENERNIKKFFRKGVAGSWRGVLNEEQIYTVVEKNRLSMERLGYVDENGELL